MHYAKDFSHKDVYSTMQYFELCLKPLAQTQADTYSFDEAINIVYDRIMQECNTAMVLPYWAPYSKHDSIDLRLDAMHSFLSKVGHNTDNSGSVSYINKMLWFVLELRAELWKYIVDTYNNGDRQADLDEDAMNYKVSFEHISRRITDNSAKAYFLKKEFLGQIMKGKFAISLHDIPTILGNALAVAFKSYYKDTVTGKTVRDKAEAREAYNTRHDMQGKIAPKSVWNEPIVTCIHKNDDGTITLRQTTRCKKSHKLEVARNSAIDRWEKKHGPIEKSIKLEINETENVYDLKGAISCFMSNKVKAIKQAINVCKEKVHEAVKAVEQINVVEPINVKLELCDVPDAPIVYKVHVAKKHIITVKNKVINVKKFFKHVNELTIALCKVAGSEKELREAFKRMGRKLPSKIPKTMVPC